MVWFHSTDGTMDTRHNRMRVYDTKLEAMTAQDAAKQTYSLDDNDQSKRRYGLTFDIVTRDEALGLAMANEIKGLSNGS